MITELPSQVIEKSPDKQQQNPNITIGSTMFTFNIDVVYCPSDTPASFIEGLNDYVNGRTVDMEAALSQLPPDRGLSI